MENSSMIYHDVHWNVVGDNKQRMVFKIPIRNLTKKWWEFWKEDPAKKAEQHLRELMSIYKQPVDANKDLSDFFMPVNDDLPDLPISAQPNPEYMKVAYELIFNEDKTKVLGQKELNSETLKRFSDEYGRIIWVQNDEIPELRKILPRERHF